MTKRRGKRSSPEPQMELSRLSGTCNRLHVALQAIGAQIVSPPREYPGIKYEIVTHPGYAT